MSTSDVHDRVEFTTVEVAVMLGVHRTTVVRMIRDGRISGAVIAPNRDRKHWRISAEYLSQRFRTTWPSMKEKLSLWENCKSM